MIAISEEMPTTTLLDLEIGNEIFNSLSAGKISQIGIEETDSYLMFLFTLENGQQIIVKKMRQVC